MCVCVSKLSLVFFVVKCEVEGGFSLIYSNTIKCECGNLDLMCLSSLFLIGFWELSVSNSKPTEIGL